MRLATTRRIPASYQLRRAMTRQRYLGQSSQDSQYGSQVGNLLSSLTGVPGLGSIAGVIGGLFGPSAHYTPSGMLYDTAANLLKTQAVTLASLQNQYYQKIGSSYRVPVLTWSMTSADDPQTGPYIAEILNAPQYAADTSPDPLIQDQADGVYDAVIKVQQSLISQINSALSGLASGSLVVRPGAAATKPLASYAAWAANGPSTATQAGYQQYVAQYHAGQWGGPTTPTVVPASVADTSANVEVGGSYGDVQNGGTFVEVSQPANYPPAPEGDYYVQNAATGEILLADESGNLSTIDPATGAIAPVSEQQVTSAGAAGATAPTGGFLPASLQPYAPYIYGGAAILALFILLRVLRR
jgi:hypothetical protein